MKRRIYFLSLVTTILILSPVALFGQDDAAASPFPTRWPLCGRTLPGVEPDQELHVVNQIDHADLGRRPRQAHGAHEQPHTVLLFGEHMLDARAHAGFARLARRMRAGMGRHLGFLRWIREVKPLLAFERYPVSDQTEVPKLALSSSPRRSIAAS